MISLSRALKEPWLRRLFCLEWQLYGRYSYFIYLIQGLLSAGLVTMIFHSHWLASRPLPPWEIAAVPLVLLLPAAVAWHMIESPLLRRGRRLAY